MVSRGDFAEADITHASARVLEKAGYTREWTVRRTAIKEDVVLDQPLYAITDLDPETSPPS